MQKISIAITDDDKLISQLLKDFLGNSGTYDILFTASDGEELVEQLNKPKAVIPEVLLLDLKMKGMNGVLCILNPFDAA